MSRWAWRMIGVLLLLVILVLLMSLQRRLIEIKRDQGATTTSKSPRP